MSWSTSKQVGNAAEVEGIELTQDFGDLSEEVRGQLAQAKAAAVTVIESGRVGPPSHRFTVILSGHANPGHGPKAGYANDSITVTVAQYGG